MERMKMVISTAQSFDDVVESFGEDCRLRGLTGKTGKEYQSIIRTFLKLLVEREISLQEVDHNILRIFLAFLKDEKKLTHKTIKGYFTALSTFFDYLVIENKTRSNIILPFRRRYLRQYKDGYDSQERKLITVEEMSRLANSCLDPRDRAIMVMLAKTGVRRGELVRMDIDDIDWVNYSVTLKPTPKRSNRTVFFDDEAALVLRRWVNMRNKLNPRSSALFINYNNLDRLLRSGVYNTVMKYSKRLGLHDSESTQLEDHFGPHCFRHWFTTHLLRNGMKREYVKELRGDKRGEAIDIYHHIDKVELRKAYLAFIPKLGV